MSSDNIRNFSIVAHIDHGKSTLADRMLEITGTIPKRKMREQVLDQMELERERGITIKLAPVRMTYRIQQSELDRRMTQKETQNDAEDDFLYGDITYKIRGVLFDVRKKLGLGHKEHVYHHALEAGFRGAGILFESRKNIPVQYNGKSIGVYQPDFIIEDKILLELKALPEIGKPQVEQIWSYLKGCDFKLALLVNYGSKSLEIKRVVYDTARHASALSASSQRGSAGVSDQVEHYVLNLIDTPGHIDFSYEVSRALKAVEGVVLLVDSTQGIQAQTLTTLTMAKELGLTIIPAVSKIDSSLARVGEVKGEIVELLGCKGEDIIETSGKTGAGVRELLAAVIVRIPPPATYETDSVLRALIFDFEYSNHQGVIVYTRVFGGAVKKGDRVLFLASGEKFTALEVGIFTPNEIPKEKLEAGEIGYVVTGIKKPGIAAVGDTLAFERSNVTPLPGYIEPKPVVWASLYPESQPARAGHAGGDDFPLLRQALGRLRLSDSSLSYEEETSGSLGRGYRCGFLGMLHLEIITERLRREFKLELIATTPSVSYEVEDKNGKRKVIYSPSHFPEYGDVASVFEPWVKLSIISPPQYIGAVLQLLYGFEAEIDNSEDFSDPSAGQAGLPAPSTARQAGGRTLLHVRMPLRELMRNFFDRLKSVSSGFASMSYELAEMKKADVVRLDIFVAEEIVPAFSRIVSRKRVQEEAKEAVERLHGILPKQLFAAKIQGVALGRILSSKTLPAMRKDVAGHLYGGDVTRKRKLLEKQKKGKKRMKERGKVSIPHDVFLKMIKSNTD